jgi:hypothetical protein
MMKVVVLMEMLMGCSSGSEDKGEINDILEVRTNHSYDFIVVNL